VAEPVKISTNRYNKQGKVDIDGNIWSVVLPGAGTELRFSQASRACKMQAARIDLLDKKIDNGTITESELDKYEEYSKKYEDNERVVYEVFQNTFRDDTKDNSDVKKWVNETPTAIIMLAFEDVKSQANSEPKEGADGRQEPTGSTE
jgi:hypothetical protein